MSAAPRTVRPGRTDRAARLALSLLGKTVATAARLRGGGASAAPGLVVETIAPGFVRDVLADLPWGVVVVSGTNGKTTTTKMVTELLRAAGLRVFTNPTGSNFTRGVASAALAQMRRGRLDANIAVLELDEAHAVHFVRAVKPRLSLLLNVQRDQADRFGETDTTAAMLAEVARATSDLVVVNARDPRLVALAAGLTVPTEVFGFADALAPRFPLDADLVARNPEVVAQRAVRPGSGASAATGRGGVVLTGLDDDVATYTVAGQEHSTRLSVFGAHNALNGAAALALVQAVLTVGPVRGGPTSAEHPDSLDDAPRLGPAAAVAALGRTGPAAGRGEVFHRDGRDVRLVLVKNSAGLSTCLGSAHDLPTLFAVSDAAADGRDVSWFWDVDVTALRGVAPVAVAGPRAHDMALRLVCDDIAVTGVEPDVTEALRRFLEATAGLDVQVLASYTTMREIRRLLTRSVRCELAA